MSCSGGLCWVKTISRQASHQPRQDEQKCVLPQIAGSVDLLTDMLQGGAVDMDDGLIDGVMDLLLSHGRTGLGRLGTALDQGQMGSIDLVSSPGIPCTSACG